MADITLCTAKNMLSKSKATHVPYQLWHSPVKLQGVTHGPGRTKGADPHSGIQIHTKHAEAQIHKDGGVSVDRQIVVIETYACPHMKGYETLVYSGFKY